MTKDEISQLIELLTKFEKSLETKHDDNPSKENFIRCIDVCRIKNLVINPEIESFR